MGRAGSRRACLNCRQRHLRCDREQPSCRRCKYMNVACKRSEVHSFRNIILDGDLSQSEHQVNTLPSQDKEPHGQRNALFVDETRSVIESHEKRTRRVEVPTEQPLVSGSGILQLQKGKTKQVRMRRVRTHGRRSCQHLLHSSSIIHPQLSVCHWLQMCVMPAPLAAALTLWTHFSQRPHT